MPRIPPGTVKRLESAELAYPAFAVKEMSG
jgi:hypothetical protein